MATKILSPHPQPLYSFPLPSKFSTKTTDHLHHQQPWPVVGVSNPWRPHRQHVVARLSLQAAIVSSYALMADHLHQQNPDSLFFLAETAGYSLSSYYTSLGLFVISFPGLWSLIKRSVKSKVSSISMNRNLNYDCRRFRS